MNPVGPEDPSVYWRRRLLVGLGVLVVLIILFLLLRSCSSDPAPTAAPSQSAVPAPEPTSTSTDSVDGMCADSDIEVTATPESGTSFPTGTPITFSMTIKNTSSTACKRNVGTKPNTVLVESNGTQVWSSDDCAPAGQDDIKTIEPGEVFQLTAVWDQKETQPGCPAGQPTAPAGSYQVVGINEQVKSSPSAFTIT